MIDTHCHIYKEYYDDIDEVINNISKIGVEKIIVNGCDMKSNLEVLDLINKYDMVYGAIGFHPTELENFSSESLSFLEEHINDDKIVAIGEIGLDYHYEDTDKEKQIFAFKKQLDLAARFNKPVIIHTRDAIKDTYDLLKMYNLNGSIHAFSGSFEMAKEFVKIGFYIGIGGVSTYKNAKNIIDVIEDIPIEYILLETDSPYLTPVPHRGKKNTPEYIPLIAEKISDIKNIEYSEVLKVTSDNAKRLFDF